MRKVFLIVTACLMACLTQNARAYEYTFDMSQALNPENIDKINKRIAMSQKTSSGKTINFWITYSEDQATSADLLDQCYIDDKGRLALVMGKTDIAINASSG